MIIHLKKNIKEEEAKKIAELTESIIFKKNNFFILITPSKLKSPPIEFKNKIADFFPMENDMQLSSKKYSKKTREINFNNISIGGNSNNTLLITGPCSVESIDQISKSAEFVKELNLTTLRAGCYKPRTSPYSFQGLGLEGLKMLSEIRKKHNLNIISEVRDASHVDEVIEHVDIIQIGAKAMYDHGILRKCGKQNKPILLKRGFGSNLKEFIQAAEFILSGGNENVMLCERGIRTFENFTRFTLDLCGVSYIKEYTNLPIILDTSHAMGYSYGVPDLTRACVAMGIDGLLIESHPNPKLAKSDAAQQLDFKEFKKMFNSLKPIAKAVGKNII